MGKRYVRSDGDKEFVVVDGLEHNLVPGERTGEFHVSIDGGKYPVESGYRWQFLGLFRWPIFKKVKANYIKV